MVTKILKLYESYKVRILLHWLNNFRRRQLWQLVGRRRWRETTEAVEEAGTLGRQLRRDSLEEWVRNRNRLHSTTEVSSLSFRAWGSGHTLELLELWPSQNVSSASYSLSYYHSWFQTPRYPKCLHRCPLNTRPRTDNLLLLREVSSHRSSTSWPARFLFHRDIASKKSHVFTLDITLQPVNSWLCTEVAAVKAVVIAPNLST